MKKFLVRFMFVVLILAVLALVAAGLFLNGAIKKGVETFGPMLTGVEVKIDAVKLSLFSGSGKIEGLLLGNPKGYKSPAAITVATGSVAVSPGSLLSDKVVVKSISLQAPEITFETNLKENNLSRILANMKSSTGGGSETNAKPKEAKAGKKLEVDDFLIRGGKIHITVTALGENSATAKLPDIHLQDLGKGPDGITPSELATLVLGAIEKAAAEASSGAIADIAKGGIHISGDTGKSSTNSLEKTAKGLEDLFKKK